MSYERTMVAGILGTELQNQVESLSPEKRSKFEALCTAYVALMNADSERFYEPIGEIGGMIEGMLETDLESFQLAYIALHYGKYSYF
jgi:hypothetical protein